ncbi:bifunctional Lsm14-like [Babesia duncani]|uniref:Bifunctional Lsm14-like n=1 Tax=Babesia duncani TaxID=323732 RepID=A0AAD9PLB4_9APIC|nr:bifunctional Lsm14-like [Babesia duncani]
MSIDPFIGSKISILSNANIRYEGLLFRLNTEDTTLLLQNVKCMGSEGRGDKQVPPSNKIHDFIVFRGEDIKDLAVVDLSQEQDEIYDDPAVFKTFNKDEIDQLDLCNVTSTRQAATSNQARIPAKPKPIVSPKRPVTPIQNHKDSRTLEAFQFQDNEPKVTKETSIPTNTTSVGKESPSKLSNGVIYNKNISFFDNLSDYRKRDSNTSKPRQKQRELDADTFGEESLKKLSLQQKPRHRKRINPKPKRSSLVVTCIKCDSSLVMRIERLTNVSGPRGHLSAVDFQPLATSSSIQRIATSGGTHVQIWALYKQNDAVKSALLFTFKKHSPFEVSTVRWSPNGRFLASTDAGGVVHVLERNEQKCNLVDQFIHAQSTGEAFEMPMEVREVKKLKYDGCSGQKTKRASTLSTKATVTTSLVESAISKELSNLLDPDAEDRNLELYDTLGPIRCPTNMGQWFDISWAPDNRSIVGGGMNGQVCVFDIYSKDIVARFGSVEEGYIKSVAWDPMTLHVAIQTSNREISIWRRSPPLAPSAAPLKWSFTKVECNDDYFEKSQNDKLANSRISWSPNGRYVAFPNAGISHREFGILYQIIHNPIENGKRQECKYEHQYRYDLGHHVINGDPLILKGHLSRIRNVRFCPSIFKPVKRGKNDNVLATDGCMLYAQSSDDSVLSIWRVIECSKFTADCLVVFQNLLDEQSSIEDIAWGNEGKWLVVAPSQGGLVLVEFSKDELGGTPCGNWMAGLGLKSVKEPNISTLEFVPESATTASGASGANSTSVSNVESAHDVQGVHQGHTFAQLASATLMALVLSTPLFLEPPIPITRMPCRFLAYAQTRPFPPCPIPLEQCHQLAPIDALDCSWMYNDTNTTKILGAMDKKIGSGAGFWRVLGNTLQLDANPLCNSFKMGAANPDAQMDQSYPSYAKSCHGSIPLQLHAPSTRNTNSRRQFNLLSKEIKSMSMNRQKWRPKEQIWLDMDYGPENPYLELYWDETKKPAITQPQVTQEVVNPIKTTKEFTRVPMHIPKIFAIPLIEAMLVIETPFGCIVATNFESNSCVQCTESGDAHDGFKFKWMHTFQNLVTHLSFLEKQRLVLIISHAPPAPVTSGGIAKLKRSKLVAYLSLLEVDTGRVHVLNRNIAVMTVTMATLCSCNSNVYICLATENFTLALYIAVQSSNNRYELELLDQWDLANANETIYNFLQESLMQVRLVNVSSSNNKCKVPDQTALDGSNDSKNETHVQRNEKILQYTRQTVRLVFDSLEHSLVLAPRLKPWVVNSNLVDRDQRKSRLYHILMGQKVNVSLEDNITQEMTTALLMGHREQYMCLLQRHIHNLTSTLDIDKLHDTCLQIAKEEDNDTGELKYPSPFSDLTICGLNKKKILEEMILPWLIPLLHGTRKNSNEHQALNYSCSHCANRYCNGTSCPIKAAQVLMMLHPNNQLLEKIRDLVDNVYMWIQSMKH